MSTQQNEIRGYVRQSRRHGQREQLAELEVAGIDRQLIYVEGKDETLGDCLASLIEGDTLAITTLGRLHNRREGILAAVRELVAKRVTIWEVSTGKRYSGALQETLEAAIAALDELANDKRRMTPAEARKAAQIRHSRTPTDTAKRVWLDTVNYPTEDEALEHEDMDGWSGYAARRKFGKRGNAVRRRK